MFVKRKVLTLPFFSSDPLLVVSRIRGITQCMNITACLSNTLGKFGRGVRTLFYLLASIFFITYFIAWLRTDELPNASREAVDNKDPFIIVDTAKYDVGGRIHYRGQIWIITKVVLQNADDWVSQNRIHYRNEQGPRPEKNYSIDVETPIPSARNFQFFYAYYGRPAD